jgi:hypothetical protein
VIKNNMFLECKSYTVNLGGGPGIWKAEAAYKKGDIVYWHDINYTCEAAHTNHRPPDEKHWTEAASPASTPFDRYVFEGNVFETCDNSGPLLFNGMSAIRSSVTTSCDMRPVTPRGRMGSTSITRRTAS